MCGIVLSGFGIQLAIDEAVMFRPLRRDHQQAWNAAQR